MWVGDFDNWRPVFWDAVEKLLGVLFWCGKWEQSVGEFWGAPSSETVPYQLLAVLGTCLLLCPWILILITLHMKTWGCSLYVDLRAWPSLSVLFFQCYAFDHRTDLNGSFHSSMYLRTLFWAGSVSSSGIYMYQLVLSSAPLSLKKCPPPQAAVLLSSALHHLLHSWNSILRPSCL